MVDDAEEYPCLLWLDDATAVMIARALETHHAELRRNGLRPPPKTVEIATSLGARVLTRRPTLDPSNFFPPPVAESTLPSLLTVARAARVLGVSPRSVERLIASGDLASVLVGRARRLTSEDVEAFLSAQNRQAPPAADTLA